MTLSEPATLGVAMAVVILLAVPGNLAGALPLPGAGTLPHGPSALSATPPPVAVNLTENSSGISLSDVFWGTTVSPRSRILPEEGRLVNATPTQVVLWPGGVAGDSYDPLTNLIFHPRAAGRSTWDTPPTSEAQFVDWCRSIQCTAIFQVPGEINDPAVAAEIVQYTVDTLGFSPAYWEIGNEPGLWTRYNQSWAEWASNLPPSAVSPDQYAQLVQNYSPAMRAVDPGIRILGLPGGSGPYPLAQWVHSTVVLNGPNLSGIAFHSYPPRIGSGTADTLANFYDSINSSSGLMIRGPSSPGGQAQRVQGMLQLACQQSKNVTYRQTGCTNLHIFVTEAGTALSHTIFNSYSSGFPGALDIAAQMTQAMDLNLTNVDIFSAVANTSNSWLSFTGEPRPSYLAYADVLSHLGRVAYSVNLTTPEAYDSGNSSLGGDLYGIATTAPADRDRADLMVVNLNVTTGVNFTPRLPGIASGTPTEVWSWNGSVSNRSYGATDVNVTPSSPAPTPQFFPEGLPGNWSLPAQGLVLFEAYPDGGAPATFEVSGLGVPPPAATPADWFVSVDNHLAVSSWQEDLVVFLPNGTFRPDIPALPLLSRPEQLPRERVAPFYAAVLQISSGAAVSEPVEFAHQWALNLTASLGGTVDPAPAWWNASEPLTVTAALAWDSPYAYRFLGWVGYGPGSFNGTSPSATLVPNGYLRERALFDRLYPVTLQETGLPPGSTWTVTARSSWSVAGQNVSTATVGSSTTGSLLLELGNGTHGFEVQPVAGFRSIPPNGSITVSGGPAFRSIGFVPITPPPPEYAVTFTESGLPAGTWWTVQVRGVSASTAGTSLSLGEANGSYGYQVGREPGYAARPPAFGFVVAGAPVVLSVQFFPVLYPAVWVETGLGPDPAWNVSVDSRWMSSSSSWVTDDLPNGTYAFAVPPVGGLEPSLPTGLFQIRGAGVTINLSFSPPTFAVTFVAQGAGPASEWALRWSDRTVNATGSTLSLSEPNGTYTYDVLAADGYFSSPSHGTLTVGGAPITVRLLFQAQGAAPSPPVWGLAAPALEVTAVIVAAGGLGAILFRWTRPRRPGAGS